jgi:streptogrisin D
MRRPLAVPTAPSPRRAAVMLAAAALLTGMVTVPQAGLAAPTPLADASAVRALATGLGDDRTGGVYVDETGRLVVAVTDEAAARTVRAAGGVAEVVKYSMAALSTIHATFDERIADTDPIPNTSWGVDPRTNELVVEIFDGVSADDEKRLRGLAADHGDAVRVARQPGGIEPKVTYETRGGIGIVSKESGAKCTLGFNARDAAGDKYIVTAGHCATTGSDLWWNREYGNHYLGKRQGWDYGGIDKDYALIHYRGENVVAYGAVTAFGVDYEITDSRYPDAGEAVKRAGRTSSDLFGTVLRPSATVTYIDGVTLKNMIETSHCSLEGDSGGPMWAGTDALGVLSGGNGPCTANPAIDRSYFQPVHWVLASYALTAF